MRTRPQSWIDVVAWGGPITSTVWLFFLVAPIRSLLLSAHTASFKLVVLGQVAIFVALYLSLVLRDPYGGADSHPRHLRRDILGLLAMTAVGMSTTMMAGSDWVAGFYFTAAASGGKLPPKWALTGLGILEVLTLITNALVGGSWLNAGQAVIFVGAIGLITAGVSRLILTIRALEQARQEVARLAVSEERLRLARDLHDLLGHSLSLIAVKSELAKQLIAIDPGQAMDEMTDVERVARSALSDVRTAVSGYRQMSLAQELSASREILSAANIRADIPSPTDEVPPTVESILAWTVREGVTNIVRHSRASRCSIHLESLSGAMRCLIRNDDSASVQHRPPSGNVAFGNGLNGLAERVRAAGGQMQATIPAEGGFLLSVTVHRNGVEDDSSGTSNLPEITIT